MVLVLKLKSFLMECLILIKMEWRRLHNEEHYDLYSSKNIIRVFQSRMRWAGLVVRISES